MVGFFPDGRFLQIDYFATCLRIVFLFSIMLFIFAHRVREIVHRHIYPAVTGKLVHPIKSAARVMSMSRNKRRDKVDTILTQVKLIPCVISRRSVNILIRRTQWTS